MINKKASVSLIFILVILAIGFIIYSNLGSLGTIVNNEKYKFSDSALGYELAKSSSIDYGEVFTFPRGDKSLLYYNNDPQKSSFSISIKKSIKDVRSSESLFVSTKNLDLKFNELNKLTVDYSDTSKLTGCNTRETSGQTESYSEIYLVSSLDDIILYKGKSLNGGPEGKDSHYSNGRITIYENQGVYILDINGVKNQIKTTNGVYQLLIKTYIFTGSCGDWQYQTDYEHNLKIIGVQLTKKNGVSSGSISSGSSTTDSTDTEDNQESIDDGVKTSFLTKILNSIQSFIDWIGSLLGA